MCREAVLKGNFVRDPSFSKNVMPSLSVGCFIIERIFFLGASSFLLGSTLFLKRFHTGSHKKYLPLQNILEKICRLYLFSLTDGLIELIPFVCSDMGKFLRSSKTKNKSLSKLAV